MKHNAVLTSLGFGLLLAIFFWGGFLVRGKSSTYANGIFMTQSDADVTEGDFSIFWETWDTLSRKYPFDDEEPKNQDRIYAATAGMVRSFGDPHTIFLPPQDAELFAQDVSGAFGGVGMEVDMRDGLVTVVAPLKDSPSEKAGIRPGDIIFAVDEMLTQDLDIDSVITLIRGKKGTPVILTILRGEESEKLDISVVRDTIKIPTIDTKLITPDIFSIALYSFTEESPDLFREAIGEFNNSGAKALVLDLRSNPGGYLQASVEIASMFLPEGTVIVKEHNGNKDDDIVLRSVGYDLVDVNVPVMVLVNGGSASSSEIVAGALSENNRAELLGTTTFGKGSVQELVRLSDKSALKVTVAQWVTPDDNSLSEGGLEPDYEIMNSIDEGGTFVDEQLIKAQEILEKQLAS